MIKEKIMTAVFNRDHGSLGQPCGRLQCSFGIGSGIKRA